MKTPLKPLCLAVLASALSAQVGAVTLEEVVVTAQKRAQGLQDVPISINAVAGEKLSQAGIEDLQDLSGSIPNLQITQTGVTNQIGMRGIFSGANKGFEQSVAMYVDDVYYGRGQLIQLPLVDIARIEVLRGPQPTLFGKNAIAGAISVVSNEPSEEFEGSISAFYEFEHKERKINAVLSGPLSDTLRGRLVLNKRDMDGWIENTHLDRDEPQADHHYVRGALAWDAGENTTVKLKLEQAQFDNLGRAMENRNPVGSYSLVFPDVDVKEDWRRQDGGYESENEVETAVVRVEHELNEFTLTSVTAYLGYDTTEQVDVDYIARNILDKTSQFEEFEQFSQELRISSPASDTLDYIAGIYYQDNELKAGDNIEFGPDLPGALAAIKGGAWDRDFVQDAKVWSVFAQFDWHISEALNLTLGARYTDESKDGWRRLSLDGSNTVVGDAMYTGIMAGGFGVFAHDLRGSRSEKQFSPLLNLQYNASDDLMLYLSYTQGSKAGGYDLRSNSFPGNAAAPGAFEFEDEQAESYELGAKWRMNNAELNLSAYRTEYEDLQVTTFDGRLGFNVQNAAEAVVQGLELDGRIQVSENLYISGALAYLDFEYKDYDVAQCAPLLTTPNQVLSSTGLPGLCNLSGRTNSHAPELSGNLNFEYIVPLDFGELRFGLTANYSDEYYGTSTLDEGTKQDAYTKWGARIALVGLDKQWEVALIGDNITDERIISQSTPLPLSETLTGRTGVAYYGIYERPRNIALQFSYNF
ncbi:MAG: TonB-dependent receptor [Cellvibrionaceae bacterium]|nr:TonB-dependent receptor [Cellvibrionaceae bacterium]